MAARTVVLRSGSDEYTAVVRDDGTVQIGDTVIAAHSGPDGSLRFDSTAGRLLWTAADGPTRWVFDNGRVFEFELQRGGGRRRAGTHHGSLSAPMPATVRRIAVSVGDRVKRGETLIVLEAMKMELPVKAAADATVEAIRCREGELVQPGVVLIGLLEDDA